ncbi:hypothetical protein MY11210_004735 [Beauveria gryllotalpidicola]
MKASFAVVAVAASASAHLSLTGPFVLPDKSISPGPLADPDTATATVTHTSNTILTSGSTSTASLAPRHVGWVTRIRKHASASDLEPAAAAAAAAADAEQTTTPTSTRDRTMKATPKVRGGADVVDQLRRIASSRACRTNAAVDPAATLRIAEHEDVLRTMTPTPRQGQKQPCPTVSGKHGANIVEAGSAPEPTATTTSLGPLNKLLRAIMEPRTKKTTTRTWALDVPISMMGSMTTDAVATPTVERVGGSSSE